jgi:hypothetical protein
LTVQEPFVFFIGIGNHVMDGFPVLPDSGYRMIETTAFFANQLVTKIYSAAMADKRNNAKFFARGFYGIYRNHTSLQVNNCYRGYSTICSDNLSGITIKATF